MPIGFPRLKVPHPLFLQKHIAIKQIITNFALGFVTTFNKRDKTCV
jgi:hypothetical protein